MIKWLKEKHAPGLNSESTNSTLAHFVDMASICYSFSICCTIFNNCSDSYIVNIGANDYIAFDLSLFSNTYYVLKLIYLTLPDVTLDSISYIGHNL